MSMHSYLAAFPSQRKSSKQKTESWMKKCVDAGASLKNLYNYSRRGSIYKKLRNYKLYNGVFSPEDLQYEVMPLIGKEYSFPANLQYRDIVSPTFMYLFGEEYKRGLNFVVRAVNEDVISQKEQKLKEDIIEILQKRLISIVDKENSEESLTESLNKVKRYHKYEVQDMRESIASQILTHYRKEQNFDRIFQWGWEDALIAGEEIYNIEEIAQEPKLRRCNPLEVHCLLPHNSDMIDDAEIILEETYMSPSKLIDIYYNELTPGQIDRLEEATSIGNKDFLNQSFLNIPPITIIDKEENLEYGKNWIDNPYYDKYGNVRVSKVTWKSRKKVGELTYLDEQGNYQKTIVDESFNKSDMTKEMSIEWFWVNEYWEGTRILDDIYLKMGPKKQQFRRLSNLSECKSGYIGTVYNANNTTSVSLMDRLVPWIYTYIVIWYRTELLIAANQGKIAMLDLSLIPDGWEIEKWLHYATAMKFGFVDSFNEGKKGQSTGKLAGNISTQNKVLDLETGQAIQGHIQLLEYIETKVQELSGVNKQRLGAVDTRELVGTTERAVTQSSIITERWFEIHNDCKRRVLQSFIDVAMDSLSDMDSVKLQYVTDDLATVFFTVNGTDFINADFGVFVSNASKDLAAMDTLKQLTHAAIQNDKAQLSQIAEILTSESMADIKAKLKEAEETAYKRQQELQQMQNEGAMQQLQQQAVMEKERLDREDRNKELDRQNKLDVAAVQALGFNEDKDVNDNNVPDVLEFEKLKQQAKNEDKKIEIEKEKLKLKNKEIETKKEIEKIKAKSKPKK